MFPLFIMLKILQVKKFPIWDIFQLDGWLNWTRILLKNKKVIQIAGNKITSKATLFEIEQKIQKGEQK